MADHRYQVADDAEIDIEGDFDFDSQFMNDVGCDFNELPSKSANLLPEFTSPTWMLEQGWSLDSSLDEKNRLAIEKMLLEEQQYTNGKKCPSTKVLKTAAKNAPRRLWTEREKEQFVHGLELYGRSWTKIASLIMSRTAGQVKSYAQDYFKHQTLELHKALVTVSTAKPTVPVLRKWSMPTFQSKVVKSKRKVSKSCTQFIRIDKTGLTTITSSGLLNNQNMPTSSSDYSPLSSSTECKPMESDISDDTMVSASSLSGADIDHMLCVSDIKPEIYSDDKCNILEEDDDLEVDIENYNDDTDDIRRNTVLSQRTASPSNVYEVLLRSANIEPCDTGQDMMHARRQSARSSVCSSEELSSSSSVAANEDCERTVISSSPDEQSLLSSHKQLDVLDSDLVVSLELDYLDDTSHYQCTTDGNIDNMYANELLSSCNELIELTIPNKEYVVDRESVTDTERMVHREFFNGRASKTPDRYIKIRNYVLDCWQKCKPEYLTKTSVRPGLKKCGDVNCIGRIHTYLEKIGAINFGCEQASYNKLSSIMPPVKKLRQVEKESMCTKAERIRKRRIRDASGEWIDEKDSEGKTIKHMTPSVVDKEAKTKAYRVPKSTYDPFKLIPCEKFGDERQAPFSMDIHYGCMVIMDIHAHISRAEVIGLLGGVFCEQTCRLQVIMAIPCRSLSTGMQCEMDPVSATQASEKISSAGMVVLGWYHSHPTFSPNPSIRDLETQLKFQEWFAKGGSNFVGIIVNPYKSQATAIRSEFRCLTVSDEICIYNNCNIPYQFDFDVVVYDLNLGEILSVAEDLLSTYSRYSHRVDLLSIFRHWDSLTCLEKMLQSTQSYLTLDGIHKQDFVAQLRQLVLQFYDSGNKNVIDLLSDYILPNPP